MKGLLLKNWYVTRRQLRVWGFIFLIYLLFSMEGKELDYFDYLHLALLSQYVLLHGKTESWDIYCGTLPCSKRQIITAKYLSNLIAHGAAFLCAMITQALRLHFYGIFTWSTYFSILLLLLMFITWLNAPMLFLDSIRKTWASVFCIIHIIVVTCFMVVVDESHTPLPPANTFPLFFLACAAAYALSWWLAVKLYQKQEIV